MKIAYVWQREDIDMRRSSGPVLHVTAIIRALKRRGHHVRLFSFHDGHPGYTDGLSSWQQLVPRATSRIWFRAPERLIRGVQGRLNLPYARLFESARFADAMLPALAEFDLIYERHDLQSSGGLMAGRRLGIPVIYELNGDIVEEYRSLDIELSAAQWKLASWITQAMFQQANHVLTVSEPLRDIAIARWRINPARVSVATNGVEVDAFSSVRGDQRTAAHYGLDGRPVVTFVGAFQPWHAVDLLLEAFASLPSRAQAQLLLVGDGPTRAAMESRVVELDLQHSVIFTGQIPHEEVIGLLLVSDITVLANPQTKMSLSTLPLKLLEYMAAGTAVVAPRTANLKGIIVDGQTAMLYAPGDPNDLAAKVETLLWDTELRKRLGSNARQEAFERHSWNRVAGDLETLFNRILTGGEILESLPSTS